MPEFVSLWVCFKCGFDNYGPLTYCKKCQYRLIWIKQWKCGRCKIGFTSADQLNYHVHAYHPSMSKASEFLH